MKTIHLTTAISDQWVEAQEGKYLDESHISELYDSEAVDVLKPDGSPLLLYRPGALPLQACAKAYTALRKMGHRPNDHRNYWTSNAVGYFSCRTTAFTRDNFDGWTQCIPLVRECDQVFRRELPSRYANQRRLAQQTAQEFVIGDTAFTTITVNLWDATHDARTTVHKDAGDLPQGFGVISVLSGGDYSGGQLIFPKYGVAVDLRTTDVLLCDVHEFHGNAPIVGEPGWERLSTILYYQTEMQHCNR